MNALNSLAAAALLACGAAYAAPAPASPPASAASAPSQAAPQSWIGNTIRAWGREGQGFGDKPDAAVRVATGAVASMADRAAYKAERCNRLTAAHPKMHDRILDVAKCRIDPVRFAASRGWSLP